MSRLCAGIAALGMLGAPVLSAEQCNEADGTCSSGSLGYDREVVLKLIEKAGCDLERIDAKDLTAEEFFDKHRKIDKENLGTPVVIKGLTDEWKAHTLWQNGGFLEKYGETAMSLQLQVPRELGNGQFSAVVEEKQTIKAHFEKKIETERILHGSETNEFLKTISKDVRPLPELVKGINMMPYNEVGRNASGSSMVQVEEKWVTQVLGAKVWLYASMQYPAAILNGLEPKGHVQKNHPCKILNKMAKRDRGGYSVVMKACLVEPGETIYFPRGYHHGACNFGEVNVAVGAMGNSTGTPDIMDAVTRCDLDDLKAYADAGGDLTVSREGTLHTPLHMSVYSNCTNIVEYLLGASPSDEPKVDPKAKDKGGYTADATALLIGNMEIYKQIATSMGADFLSGTNAFETAFSSEHTQEQKKEIVMTLLDMRVDPLKSQKPALAAASANLDFESFKAFSEAFPKDRFIKATNARDKEGYTPLHQAIRGNKTEMVKWLLEKGAKAADGFERASGKQLKSVHIATMEGHVEILKLLIEHKANINSKTGERATIYDMAVEGEHFPIVDYFNALGGDNN